MVKLSLKKGTVLISNKDLSRVKKYKWFINNEGYVKTLIDGKQVYLHRFILSAPSSLFVDHINHNKLDNRRCNLRFATQRENLANSRLSKKNTSGYKGVIWDKRRNIWKVAIMINYKNIFGGHFKDKVEAAKRYNELARKYNGRFAYLNQIP